MEDGVADAGAYYPTRAKAGLATVRCLSRSFPLVHGCRTSLTLLGHLLPRDVVRIHETPMTNFLVLSKGALFLYLVPFSYEMGERKPVFGLVAGQAPVG